MMIVEMQIEHSSVNGLQVSESHKQKCNAMQGNAQKP